jgi:hypothetical protein
MASFGQLEGASGDPVDPAVQPERVQGAEPHEPRQPRRSGCGYGVEPSVLSILAAAGGPVQRRYTLPPQPHEPTEQQHRPGDGQNPPDRWAPTPPRASLLVRHSGGCTASAIGAGDLLVIPAPGRPAGRPS